ncbi:MAG: hypothetical protein R2940_01685 [Syntrophotaleaceae bacterium]
MKFFMQLLVIFTMFAGASALWAESFPLTESDMISVRECRPVGKYPGPSGYSFWGPPPVLADFRYQTALKAREAGATHIVWKNETNGIRGRVTGYAFDCTGVKMPTWSEEDWDIMQ